jgi:hypothetical protein
MKTARFALVVSLSLTAGVLAQAQQTPETATPAFMQPIANPVAGPGQKLKPVIDPVTGLPQIDPATGQPMMVVVAMTDAERALQEYRLQVIPAMPMAVTKPEWTEADENAYSSFVAKIGKGIKANPGHTIKWYMRNASVNPFAGMDPQGLVLYSDCADLPYFLRLYFAAKTGLPFSYALTTNVNPTPFMSLPNQEAKLLVSKDTDSAYGNLHTGRGYSNMASAPGREKNFVNYWTSTMDSISTGTFRVGALTPNYNLSDVYPVKIDNNGIRPGTIVHTTGHIYVVTGVDERGSINMIDAHPDNSVTFKTFDSSKLARSRPDHALGFFRFRPSHVVGGNVINGVYYNGKVQTSTDQELFQQGVWSLEQWYGPNSNIAPGSTVSPTAYQSAYSGTAFFDLVRARLKGTSVVVAADEMVGDTLVALCDDFRQRVSEVQTAIDAGMTQKSHPTDLPDNVFSTSGDWETFSSPSRDGRLRDSVGNLPTVFINYYRQAKAGTNGITFNGGPAEYQASIRSRLALMDATCQVVYKNSAGTNVSIPFTELIRRAPNMSFDPYHCPERRWGKNPPTCKDGDVGGVWYLAQQTMRNTVGKQDANENLVIRSDRPITLEMAQSGRYVDQPAGSTINLGSARSKLIDVQAYVNSPQFLQDLAR